MAKCNSCVHFDVCEKHNATVDFDVDDGVCLHYEKQVVRCKDCKHCAMYRFFNEEEESLACVDTEDGEVVFAQRVDENHFCSYGEKKDK